MKIDANELWIGDWLRLKKSGRVGKFAGHAKDDKIKVSVSDKIVICSINNIELTTEPSPTNLLPNKKQTPQDTASQILRDTTTIDLHIESLNPSLMHARPERIIDYQVKAAEQFLKNAIAEQRTNIVIIHGKGAGVLKSEVDHLIHLYKEHIKAQFPFIHGGSIELWLTVK